MPKRTLVEFAFLVLALAPLLHFGISPFLGTFSVVFVAIILEALPFLLIGSSVSGFLEEFVSQGRVARLLSEGKARTPFLAAALGLVFPVCECAIVPVIRRLLHKGMPLSAAVAFMLGGPIVNPIVFGSTLVAYGLDWKIALIRIVCGYSIAVFAGFLFTLLSRRHQALLPPLSPFPVHEDEECHRHEMLSTPVKRIGAALVHGAEDFLDMFPFMVMGAFMAALFHNTLDRSLIYSLWDNPVLAILLMMGLAFLLSVCSEADAFVAASFQTSLPLSAQMAFMVFGPMLDLKLFSMYFAVFRKKAVLLLSGMTFSTVLGVMVLFHFLRQWVLG